MKLIDYVKIHGITSLICLVIIVLSLSWAQREHRKADEARLAAVSLQNETRHLLQLLTDEETGQRGFLLTRDSVFLEPYNRAVYQKSIVTELIKDRVNTELFERLISLMEQRQNYFLRTFTLANGSDEDYQQAVALVKEGTGKRYMDSMRAVLATMNKHAELKAELADTRFKQIELWTDIIFFGSITLILFIWFAPIIWLKRKASKPLARLIREIESLPDHRNLDLIQTESPIEELQALSHAIKKSFLSLVNYEHKLSETVIALEQTKAQHYMILSNTFHKLQGPARSLNLLLKRETAQEKASKTYIRAQKYSDTFLNAIDDLKKITAADSKALESNEPASAMKLSSLMKNTLMPLKNLAKKHNIQLIFDPFKNDNNYYFFNKVSIQQILTNLVKNAIVHSEGSEVALSIKSKQICQDRTAITLTVADNGKGIAEELQTTLFTAFQSNNSVKKGKGIGLSICRSLALQLPDGKLNYEDNINGGAVFVLTFSVQNQALEELNSSTDIIDLRGLKVLIVEESQTLLKLSQLVLERADMIVKTAHHAQAAIDIIDTFEADIVLMDISIPLSSEVDLTKHLRNHGFNKPIIGLANPDSKVPSAKIIDQGADYVITKPIKLSSLEAAINIIRNRNTRDVH